MGMLAVRKLVRMLRVEKQCYLEAVYSKSERREAISRNSSDISHGDNYRPSAL